MCGIAGFADASLVEATPHEADLALLRGMCDVIRHRGPDDEGAYVRPGVGLGMRRLSIIDLATGHQPIHNEDATVWVVFNGEIYNYRELRRELQSRGHRFYTGSDTEAIVHAYEEWGEDSLVRLRGMFGLAIWNAAERTLLLARDRAGIKPLHFVECGTRLYFASEVKSLLAAGVVRRELDVGALEHYLAFLYPPGDRSMFKGVRKIPPGHYVRWQAGRLELRPYWRIAPSEPFDGTEEDAAAGLRAVLSDAVRAHMVSDVPLGAFLSGGIDSSIVVGLMAESSSRPVKTFSIGFDEPEYDELEHARAVAVRFGTDHHELVVRPDALSILDRLVRHFDEPFADSSAIPTWYVSEMARRHVTVVLSGDGGDELFGGYDRYLPHPRVASFDRVPVPGKRQLARVIWPLLPHGATGKNFLRHVSADPDARYLDSLEFFKRDERLALYTPAMRRAVELEGGAGAALAQFERFAGLSPQSRMMRFDFEHYLPEDVLTKVDRMSMAHSIESRVPLLDHQVIEYAAALPSWMKIRNGRRKHILKQAVRDLLPPSILDRRKQGFGVPLDVWFRGALTDIFSDVLRSPRTTQRGYFRPAFVERLIAEHLSGRRDHALRLWQLLMFELWHREYLDAAPVAAAVGASRNTLRAPLHARGSAATRSP